MCILFFEPLCSFYEIPAGVLRGTGHSLSPAIAAIIGTCCFRIIWIYTIFGEYCQLSVLYYAFPISWILTIVLIMIDFAIVIKNRQPLKQNSMLNCKKIPLFWRFSFQIKTTDFWTIPPLSRPRFKY